MEGCVRSWDKIQMVHRSMEDGSRMVDELYIKRECFGVGGFPFLLSLLVLLYSKQYYDFERYSNSCSLDTHFEFSPATFISPALDPARYNHEESSDGCKS